MSVPICIACGSAAVVPTDVGTFLRCRRCGRVAARETFLGHVRRPQLGIDRDGRAHVDGRVLAPGITDGRGMPGEGET